MSYIRIMAQIKNQPCVRTLTRRDRGRSDGRENDEGRKTAGWHEHGAKGLADAISFGLVSVHVERVAEVAAD